MFKGNMSKLLKQAKDMQEQIEEAQSQLSELIIEADSGGGMVSVKVNGKQEIIELNIDPDAMSEDKEMLEEGVFGMFLGALTYKITHNDLT